MELIENSCCVCLENLNDVTQKKVYLQCCGNSLHIDCFKMLRDNYCPLCRNEMYHVYHGNNNNIIHWLIYILLMIIIVGSISILYANNFYFKHSASR